MNDKYRRIVIPLTMLAGALLGACEQLGLKTADTALPGRLTRTCNDPNQANLFKEPDGGLHESSQGWFYKAEVRGGGVPPSTSLYCWYGLDKIDPVKRPVYTVHYPLTGFGPTQCTVSGRTVTCVRDLVVK